MITRTRSDRCSVNLELIDGLIHRDALALLGLNGFRVKLKDRRSA